VKRRHRGTRVTRPGRVRPRPLSPRAVRARRRLARLAGSFRSRRSAARRVVFAVALLVVVLFPLPVLASDTPPRSPACQGSGCHAQPASAQLWAVGLTGNWSAGTGPDTTGDGGTVPAFGQQAYVAVGDGVAVLGTGLNLTAYTLSRGKQLWNTTLSAPDGTVIVSVRAWPGVITVGLLAPGGRSRTEVVLDSAAGTELRRYPAAVFGGAVTASAAATVIIGPATVTSYSNATGRVRWRHTTGGSQSWQVDGKTLYMAESPGGYLSSSPLTALRVMDLNTGTERMLSSPLGHPFSGTLAVAAEGAVLFASPGGVSAYSGSTGGRLWTRARAVPEGTDPAAGLVYLSSPDGALTGVDPRTDTVLAAAPAAVAATGLYVVRDGVALGLSDGANGGASGYSLATGRTAWPSLALPWPHFFSDLSGLGGSAAFSGDTVVVTACPHLAASPGTCADPELVALRL
jgi:outer membrane protein assembly factor BamB